VRIAIDASRTTLRQRTGTENYAVQLIRELLALDSGHHYDLYFRDVPPDDIFPKSPNCSCRIIPFPRMWTHIRFAAELWRSRPDVTWVPAHTLPRYFPGRAVVTVHDLGYLHFPEAHPDKERRYLDWSTRYSAKRAAQIMADSLATQHDLTKYYGIDPAKIQVVYPGSDENLQPVRNVDKLASVRQKYNLPETYLLFLGTLQPRKNIARLVQAFDRWRKVSSHPDMVLALGGKAGWLFDPTRIEGVENVQILGYIADEDIAALYSGAVGFVFPSLYEGFGFPVLEAMRCGTPVLCSDTSSLPELVGEAALLVNPLEVDSIAEGIRQLVEDESLRRQLIEKGKQQVSKFTWKQAARDALRVLEMAAQ
jgi:glycosyltransferase involved in cell wall biosynthesis